MTDPFATLEGTIEQVWQRLGRGVADRRSPARHPVLATVGALGGEARVVVLRGADRDAQTLTVYTDTASEKVGELKSTPGATLLVWDEKASFQIRLRVRIEIVQGDQATWARVPDTARSVYGGTPEPGAPVDDPSTYLAEPDVARFTVLLAHIVEIETLQLATPHRRAKFRDGSGIWVAP